MDFYRGNVLRIDLSAQAATVEPLNMDWAERYIGGKGLLLRYLWAEVPPKVDAAAEIRIRTIPTGFSAPAMHIKIPPAKYGIAERRTARR